MRVEATGRDLLEIPADLHVVVLADGQRLPEALAQTPGAADARTGYRKRTLLRPAPRERVLVLGAGDGERLGAERLRVLAAIAAREAAELGAKRVAWRLEPQEAVPAAEAAAAAAEGAILSGFRYDRLRSAPPEEPPGVVEELTISAERPEAVAARLREARAAAAAANRARELQSLPANLLTPTALAEHAARVAANSEALSCEVLDGAEVATQGLGGLAAVAAGSREEPRLITLRYEGGGSGERIGLVGKAVTFDSGGISIKPAAGMHEMKMDMSGGAAVLEALAAVAELGLELDVVAVVPTAENMPSGSATRPGDVITLLGGRTVEVTNTDAEGRLILADALTWCVRELDADRLVDVATLTGAVKVALGSTYAALIANDDEWAGRIAAAGQRSGELVWRLPLHEEYKQLMRSPVADLANSGKERKAGTIYAGSFLEEFVEDRPWAHVDIAGTAWDVGREYVGKGPTGFGTRLLVALAAELA